MKETSLYNSALKIVATLQKEGFTALFAGGAVRDSILQNQNLSDIDIATSATPDEVESLFHNTHPVGKSFGVIIVVIDDTPYEVATFREEGGYQNGRHPEEVSFSGPKEDAHRRDFTINGLFYDPVADKLFDFIDGEKDLKKGIIKTIGDATQRFSEDYLRLLRAIRFSARFDFPIEEKTWNALCERSSSINKISKERVFQEITKMITGPKPVYAVELLQKSGLLKEVLPEVEKMVGVEQPPEYHPEGDVFVHTLEVIKNLPENPSDILAWSALLHDVGKPATQTFSDRIRFNNHHHVGSKIAAHILQRFKAPKKFSEEVIACVDNHMHFINVQQMRLSKLKKFLARETLETELELHKADCLSSHGSIDNYTFLKEKQLEFKDEGVKPDPLVLGRDLIAFGLKPGPYFGEILSEAYDLQLEEKLKNPEDAKEWIKNKVKKIK
jgi:poly(A) polymerase